MSTRTGRAFILRSEVIETTSDDAARRKTIISELSDADLDRVAGGTNHIDFTPDWNPKTGGDQHPSIDPGEG